MTKTDLYFKIEEFLKQYANRPAKFLLAFSGGADSTALLHLLKKGMSNFPFTLELAHVDHGQREESSKEALLISAMAQDLGLVLHSRVIDQPIQGNLENFYREERIQFFNSLAKSHPYDAVLLAHHRDDLNETVLKRFLEGANFEHLAGMHLESFFGGVRYLRPLLDIPKKSLLSWLHDEKIPYFNDYTNEDVRFLRARMRKELMPSIEESFGKNIGTSLRWAAQQSELYHSYLEHQVDSKFMKCSGPLGFYVDCTKDHLHPVEIQFFLKKIARSQGHYFSRQQIEQITLSLLSKDPMKIWEVGKKKYHTYAGFLFYLEHEEILTSKYLDLTPGIYFHGCWRIEVKETTEQGKSLLGWRRLFSKEPHFVLFIPNLQGQKMGFKVPSCSRFYFDKKITKWWEEHQIPPLLRGFLPFVEQKEGLMAELLSGKTPYCLAQKNLKLSICYQKRLK